MSEFSIAMSGYWRISGFSKVSHKIPPKSHKFLANPKWIPLNIASAAVSMGLRSLYKSFVRDQAIIAKSYTKPGACYAGVSINDGINNMDGLYL